MMTKDGSVLDAEFQSTPTRSGFDIVMESRGGSTKHRPPRNPDYNKVLRLLLERVSRVNAVIRRAAVESTRTEKLPDSVRTIASDRLKYPIALRQEMDFESLRLDLTKPQAAIGRLPGARGSGNMSKRIRISFEWVQHRISIEDLDALLIEGKLEEDTSTQGTNGHPDESSILNQWYQKAALYEGSSPRTTTRLRKSIERGTVGEMVKEMFGYQCQICQSIGMKTQTFRTKSGNDYVEAHHVVPVSLGQEGTLSPRNVIAVCASHHRELHYGAIASVHDLGNSYRIVVEGGTAVVPKSFPAEQDSVPFAARLQREPNGCG